MQELKHILSKLNVLKLLTTWSQLKCDRVTSLRTAPEQERGTETSIVTRTVAPCLRVQSTQFHFSCLHWFLGRVRLEHYQ
jgi:hypothetical protein